MRHPYLFAPRFFRDCVDALPRCPRCACVGRPAGNIVAEIDGILSEYPIIECSHCVAELAAGDTRLMGSLPGRVIPFQWIVDDDGQAREWQGRHDVFVNPILPVVGQRT